MKSNSESHKKIAFSPLRAGAAFALLLALSIFGGACTTSTSGGDGAKSKAADNGIKFPHEKHVGEELGIGCDSCHDTTSGGNLFALVTPAHELCALCHVFPDDMSEDYTPELLAKEECDFCHTRADRTVDPRASKFSPEIKFAHDPHVAAELECSACHGDALSGIHVPAQPMMPACVECHKQQSPALAECAVCHNEISRDTIPAMRGDKKIAHDAPWIWETVHGREAQVDPMYCAMCHDQEEHCDECHSRVPPQNHTLAWRNHTHGLRAAWDRTSCAVCHEEDTCQKCHENMTPKSHRGGWGGLANRHCVNCHYPPEQSGCVVCHEEISHQSALPSPHLIAVYPPNCGACHPGGLPNRAPHLMNSTVHCTVCHN